MQKKEFKKIIVWFENQERVELMSTEIESLLFLDITRNYAKSKNHLIEFLECKDFILMLKESVYKLHYFTFDDKESEDTIEHRLTTMNDISSIEVVYNDSKEDINVVWNHEKDYTNSYQTTDYYKDKNLVVRCNKTETAKDYIKEI